tara:strand:- start:42 stop:338 length:297 start_codon:yes stop_codon:yes gene_type:complete
MDKTTNSIKKMLKTLADIYNFLYICLIKIKTMYKITNKKTGFTQYRNAKDTANFVFKNKHTNYTIREINEFDITKYEDLIYGVLVIVTFVLSFFILQF